MPWTVIEHGVGCPAAVQVAESLMETTIEVEVLGRRSANPDGAGKVVMSITRKRNRVIAAPVLFTNLRRMSRVPKVELGPAGVEPVGKGIVKSRTLFGGEAEPAATSSNATPNTLLRWIGDERFCGAGAPNR